MLFTVLLNGLELVRAPPATPALLDMDGVSNYHRLSLSKMYKPKSRLLKLHVYRI